MRDMRALGAVGGRAGKGRPKPRSESAKARFARRADADLVRLVAAARTALAAATQASSNITRGARVWQRRQDAERLQMVIQTLGFVLRPFDGIETDGEAPSVQAAEARVQSKLYELKRMGRV